MGPRQLARALRSAFLRAQLGTAQTGRSFSEANALRSEGPSTENGDSLKYVLSIGGHTWGPFMMALGAGGQILLLFSFFLESLPASLRSLLLLSPEQKSISVLNFRITRKSVCSVTYSSQSGWGCSVCMCVPPADTHTHTHTHSLILSSLSFISTCQDTETSWTENPSSLELSLELCSVHCQFKTELQGMRSMIKERQALYAEPRRQKTVF